MTGVASGGLGTAANLEDTQLWSLEDLRQPELDLHGPDLAPDALGGAEPVRGHQPDLPPALPAPVIVPTHVEAVRGPRVAANRGRPRTGVLAAAAIGVLALAAMFAIRDGLPGAGTSGSGGAGAFPSLPPGATAAPAATAPVDAGGGGKGKGGGKGNGGGGKNKN